MMFVRALPAAQLVNPLTAGSVGQHIHITDEQKVAQRERSRNCVSEK